jgi:hypothetical protein
MAFWLRFMARAADRTPQKLPFFAAKLRFHFGREPATLPILAETFESYEQPSLHLAIEDFLAREGRSADVLGVAGQTRFMGKSLSALLARSDQFGNGTAEGPVEYTNVRLDGDRVLSCIERGLYLVDDGDHPLAIFVRGAEEVGASTKFKVEVMGTDRSTAETVLSEIRQGVRSRNVYRGQVLSLTQEGYNELKIAFRRLPKIGRDAIVLPEGLLDQIERQTIRFGERTRQLLAAGLHLKRGVLLHGPPGTGKTLTAMYLAGAMRDRTVLLLTGRSLNLISKTCEMARMLQPSIVILEDIDLIAEDRVKGVSGYGLPLLFELLNEMDGLADDADVLFLLTTNRPELLEPALASRPGRVDQAVEIPLPDEECRRRLFGLYGRGLVLRVEDLRQFISRTEGASAAFIRELVRKAALLASEGGPQIVIEDHHLNEALHDQVVKGGALTRSLLGFQPRAGFHD